MGAGGMSHGLHPQRQVPPGMQSRKPRLHGGGHKATHAAGGSGRSVWGARGRVRRPPTPTHSSGARSPPVVGELRDQPPAVPGDLQVRTLTPVLLLFFLLSPYWGLSVLQKTSVGGRLRPNRKLTTCQAGIAKTAPAVGAVETVLYGPCRVFLVAG